MRPQLSPSKTTEVITTGERIVFSTSQCKEYTQPRQLTGHRCPATGGPHWRPLKEEQTVSLILLLQFAVVLAAIYFGSRAGGVGLGLWGAVGVLVLTVVFGLPPTSPPI